MLADAGHAGLSLTLSTYAATSTMPDIQKLTETIGAFWAAIGVDVDAERRRRRHDTCRSSATSSSRARA